MELRQLGLFVGVADELHFGRAAERLYIAQPALSQHIRRLERELGVALFDRGKRRIRLTSAGAAFYSEARRVLDRADQALNVARDASAGHLGRVVLGHVPGIADDILATWLSALTDATPGLSLRLHPLTSIEAARDLVDGEIDLAVVDGPIDDPGVDSLTLVSEPLVAVLNRHHPAADRASIRIGALASTPWTVPHTSWLPTLGNAVEELRAAVGANVAGEVRNTSDWLLPVAAGFAVTLAPASLAVRWADVVTVRVDDVDSRTAACVCWRPESASPQALGALQVARHVRAAQRRCSTLAVAS